MNAPRFSRALLRRLSAPAHRDDIDGDLNEWFAATAGSAGPRRARWQYRRIVAVTAWHRLRKATGSLNRSCSDAGRDLRIAGRTLSKNPAFTITAILTVAIGIGSTTAIGTIVDSVLLRPLPHPESDRIVQVISYRREGPATIRAATMARPFLLGLHERSQSFAEIGLFDSFSNISRRRLTLTIAGSLGAAELRGTRITPVLFSMLGAQPRLGRLFVDGDDDPDRNRLIILSERAWRTQLAGDPQVLGSSISLDGRPYTLVGVVTAGFAFPDAQTDFWIPLTSAPVPPPSAPRSDTPNSAYADGVFARLKKGVSIAAAREETDSILRALSLESAVRDGVAPEQTGFPPSLARRADVVSMKDELVAQVRPMLWMLSLAAAIVLLLACANLASLFLERADAVRTEVAVRTALGATPAQLLRQRAIEGITVGAVGGTLGALFALWMVQLTVPVLPPDVPRVDEISVRLPLMLVSILGAAGAGAVFAVVPAWRSVRNDRSGATSRLGRMRTRTLIVAAEVGLAAMLCIGAGLLIRSFAGLIGVNPGYDAHNVTTFQIVWPEGHTIEPVRFYEDVLTRLHVESSIEAAAATDVLPVAGAGAFHLTLGGLPVIPGADPMVMRLVTRHYFEALAIQLSDGRSFSEAGRADFPEVIVNKEFVRRYFGGANPVGQFVGDASDRYQIIGVVSDVTHGGLTGGVRAEYYVDLLRFGLTDATRPHFVVRSQADPGQVAALIRSTIRNIDQQAGVDLNQQTMADMILESVAKPRFNTFLLAAFAAVSLVLATVGIYGVISHAVTQQTHDIGIRLAIGASPSRVMAAVVGQSLRVTGIGAALGLLSAAAVTGYLDSMLFELSPLDPSTFVAVATILLLVALLASYVPAARASRVDPLVALRHN